MRRTGRQTSTWMPRRTERIRRSRSSLRLRAHTAGEVGFGSAHRSRALPDHGRAVRGAEFNSCCRTWMRQRAIGATDRNLTVRGLYPYPGLTAATHEVTVHLEFVHRWGTGGPEKCRRSGCAGTRAGARVPRGAGRCCSGVRAGWARTSSGRQPVRERRKDRLLGLRHIRVPRGIGVLTWANESSEGDRDRQVRAERP